MGEADEGEDEDLSADTPETNCAGEAALVDGGQHPGDVVGDSEDDQRIDEAVEASKISGEPGTNTSDPGLDGVPDGVKRHGNDSFRGHKKLPTPIWGEGI